MKKAIATILALVGLAALVTATGGNAIVAGIGLAVIIAALLLGSRVCPTYYEEEDI